MKEYNPKTTPWQIDKKDFPLGGSYEDQMRFLLKYAVLAPSSHNTQPWKFSIKDNKVDVYVDKTRWLKVADQDQRELFISVGCALENLMVAGEHFGLECQPDYFPGPEDTVAEVRFQSKDPSQSFREGLLDAIPERFTNHNAYNESPISSEDLQIIHNCFDEEDIFLHTTDHPDTKRKVEEMIIQADAIQFSDPDYREELGYWIGQGVFGASWLMSKIGQLAVNYINMGKTMGKKDSQVLMSSPVLAVISSRNDDRLSQVRVGQVFERIFLTATRLGISVHPMSQILEVPQLKDQVAELVPTTGVIPQHTFRMGYGEPEKEHTPRRPVEEVLL